MLYDSTSAGLEYVDLIARDSSPRSSIDLRTQYKRRAHARKEVKHLTENTAYWLEPFIFFRMHFDHRGRSHRVPFLHILAVAHQQLLE